MDELTRLRRSGMVKLDIVQKIMFELSLEKKYKITEGSHFRQRHNIQRLGRKKQKQKHMT